MKTTLNAIRAHGPCAKGWGKLLRHLGKTQADDEPLRISSIFESNGLDDALWCLRAVTGYDREIRLYAVWCARQVQHLMTDSRSLNALDVAKRHADGVATTEELDAASDAAWAAAWAAASDAAWAAAWAAASDAARAAASYTASDAARAAASDAARAAARAAASDAVRAAPWAAASDAAWAASWDAAWAAASDAAWAAQKAELLRICAEIEAREAA